MRRGKKGLNDFRFGIFIGRFESDGAASMAVKGLSLRLNRYVSRFGLAVRLVSGLAGKRKDLGSIPLRLSFLLKKVVVCGHRLVTLSITSY